MARPPKGVDHVDKLDGSAEAKKRVKTILETIAGEKSVAEACEALGVSEARFHELREEILAAAVEGAEPGRAGRPPKIESANGDEIKKLQAELQELRIELQASRVREEVAIAMPHLLKPGKKTKRRASSQELFEPKRGTPGE
jgi:hypothetical protein